jgi:hypothetical protein
LPPAAAAAFAFCNKSERVSQERIEHNMEERPVGICDADVAAAFAAAAAYRSPVPSISSSSRFAVHNTALSLQ